jgi:hypothetical protein
MQWLNDCCALRVNHVVIVPFSIGRYNDHVECDVVPMQACQLLLGTPWLYDRNVDFWKNQQAGFHVQRRVNFFASFDTKGVEG